MDYNLRRKTILLTILAGITVILAVIVTNAGKLQNEKSPSTVSDSNEETVVLVEGNGLNNDSQFIKIGDDTSHWKTDETFFDNEKDTLAQRLMDEMSTLSIKAVSVERDIRVRIIDYTGNLKSGERFEIVARNLENDKQTGASDNDEDGIVYLPDVAPGKYVVYLRPYEGYKVPDEGLKLTVRDRVEYTMIEDISLKMVSEDSINREKEDVMGIAASKDADKKLKTLIGKETSLKYGIDVSSRNGEIDWNRVYKSGVRFVMLRAGYRGAESGDLVTDEYFKENAKKAVYAGLDVGAYYYSQALNTVEAVEEASALLALASDCSISYPFVIRFDVLEGSGRADSVTEEVRTEIADAFCKTIEASGKKACIYTNKNWLETNIDYSKLNKYMLWLAEYHEPPSYDGYYDMWQYSNVGKVDGIDGDVSLNISYIN